MKIKVITLLFILIDKFERSSNKALYNLRIWITKKIRDQKARDIVKVLESKNGNLNSNIKKEVRNYSIRILGSKKYIPMLNIFAVLNQEFKDGCIPGYYYETIVVPSFQGKYGQISHLGSLNKLLFNSEYIPDILYFINGSWFSKEYKFMTCEQVIETISKYEKVVFKSDNSLQGAGVHIFKTSEIELKTIESKGEGIIQSYIEQHPFFDRISSNSVATIRITTSSNSNNKININACYLRVGRDKDNIVKSSSNIRIPVLLHGKDKGGFRKTGYMPNWEQITQHPDTGFIFENESIPNFNKCIDAVIELHSKIPFVRIIGWDVIIDKDSNVKVMEWNGKNNAIDLSEAIDGPIFKGMGLEKLWMK